MKGRSARQSQVEMIQQVLPGDTNPHGTVFGGKVMEWIDIAGAVTAMRHARASVVTASFDRVDFHAPARSGDVMNLSGRVNYTGRTSLEVWVEVLAENPRTGKKVLTTEALITYVAVDAMGSPKEVEPLVPRTADEVERFRAGEARRRRRLAERSKRRRSR